jgi:hypothetical protein
MLLCRCEDMTPLQQVQMFSAGSGEPLRTNVELAMPTDLQTAMSLARTYERRLATVTHDLESITSLEPKTAPSSTTLAPAASTTPQPHLRRLLPEELAAKWANGECYHCPEKYVDGHKCKSKGVFLLELGDSGNLGAAANLGIDVL